MKPQESAETGQENVKKTDIFPADPRPAGTGVAGSDDRDQLFEDLRQAFFTLAHRQPLLLILEDAQWASTSSLDWLTFLAPNLGTSPLPLAVRCRTGEVGVDHALSRLSRERASPPG